MFSFKQSTIDDSVNRFYDSTSGPLRDMFSQNNAVDNLKAIFRDTGGSSETVINGAALESVDEIATTQRCWCRRESRSATRTGTTGRRSHTGCASSCTRMTMDG